MIQLTDRRKLNKKEGPSVDNSNPLRRENKTIMGGTGKEEPGCWVGEGKRRENGNRIGSWRRETREKPSGQGE
jgi:hypothetical protein